MSKITVAMHGACGKMGQTIVRGILPDSDLKLVGAIESPSHPKQGTDIGEVCGLGPVGVHVASDLPVQVDVVIDFSMPEAALAIAKRCAAKRIPLIVATTGFSPKEREELLEAHDETALLIASNMSLVVNLMMKLVRDAAAILRNKDFDVEIIERHHRFKTDAPSGTALTLASIIENEMGHTARRHGREGITGERPRHEIGIHALRVGDNVGEHTVIFSTLGETLELVHRGHNRESYAKGALAAAKFLVGKGPGLYSMSDVLGLSEGA